MRLFIASRFDDNILDALSDYQDDLRALGIAGNYTRRENLHITLVRKFKNPHGVALPEAVVPQNRISRISLGPPYKLLLQLRYSRLPII